MMYFYWKKCILRREQRAQYRLNNQCIANVLIDIHRVIHQAIAFGEWQVVRETRASVGRINHEIGAEPITQDSNMSGDQPIVDHEACACGLRSRSFGVRVGRPTPRFELL